MSRPTKQEPPFNSLFRENFEALPSGLWLCRRCGLEIKSNRAGAASHLSSHVRATLSPKEPLQWLRAAGGIVAHAIRPGAGENALDAEALCGFFPGRGNRWGGIGRQMRARARWISRGDGLPKCHKCAKEPR
jgi:hypothetical protein